MIEVRNLVKRYGNHLAVDHISFTVEKGQIYGFLGPNGAGKSTTMNIMTGYLGATEGEVLINGHDILKEPEEAKRCIGYLPELPPLYMDMTVMEYLEFAAELKKVKKEEREREINKVLSLVKLQDVKDRLIRNLSKGYKQRVGLAQAVIGFPEIIILDEPTVGLDPKQIIEIRELIRELSKEHTVILSSHILAEVREVCDYVMIISKGKLVASDTPDNLEKLMQGAATIELQVKAEPQIVRGILARVGHIVKADYKLNDEKTTNVTIEVGENQDIREQLFYAFADAKCPILMMRNVNVTLEDVFLELTQSKPSQTKVIDGSKRKWGRKAKEEIQPEEDGETENELTEEENVKNESSL